MNTLRFRIIAWVSISFLLALEGLGWGQMITNAGERNNADFMAFYAAGKAAQAQGFSNVYDVLLQQKIEQTVLGFQLADGRVLLYNHVPYLVPILALLVDNNYAMSFARWVLLLLVIYIFALFFFSKYFLADKDKNSRIVLCLGALTFFPLFVSLWQGQDTAFLFFGMVLWCVGILKKNDWLAAAGLALSTVRPHICIILFVPLLFRQRSILWRFILLAGFLVVASILLVGKQGMFGFLNLLEISADAKWFGINPGAMVNLYGIVVRTATFLDPGTLSIISWLLYAAGILGVVILWTRSKSLNEVLLSQMILLSLLTAPHLQYHDLTPLILPLFFFLKQKMDSGASPMWILLLMGTSFFLLAGFIFTPLQFVMPYILMAALAWIFFTKTDWLSKTAVQ